MTISTVAAVAATACKSPKLLATQQLASTTSSPPSSAASSSSSSSSSSQSRSHAGRTKGITMQLTYIPLSPRLQALASPGPCTPFSLEEQSGVTMVTGALNAPGSLTNSSHHHHHHHHSYHHVATGVGGDYLAHHGSHEKLDAAFARHRAGAGERRTYSAVLASQRRHSLRRDDQAELV